MPYVKQRDRCVLFLEDVFGTTVHPQRLRDAGFEVECFAHVFNDGNDRPLDGIKDPQIIRHCNSHRRILITTDKNIRFTHVEAIKKSKVAIIATESNRSVPVATWVEALIRAKAVIERKLKRQRLPWFARLSSAGKFSHIETITSGMRTRRYRPREIETPEVDHSA